MRMVMRMIMGMIMRVVMGMIMRVARRNDGRRRLKFAANAHIKLYAGDLRARRGRCGEFAIGKSQLGDFPFQRLKVGAGVDERADGHIAADSGETVKICGFHETYDPVGLALRRGGGEGEEARTSVLSSFINSVTSLNSKYTEAKRT